MQDLSQLAHQAQLYAQLAAEWGASQTDTHLAAARDALANALAALKQAPLDDVMRQQEPDDLQAIRALRPQVAQRMRTQLDPKVWADKVEAAMLCRFAGCTLGAIVENWSVERMEAWAQRIGDPFPPTRYWRKAWAPDDIRYRVSTQEAYTQGGMHGVPVDDDVNYTLLGLLIAERFGFDFTTEDVGQAWLDWVPMAYTAEEVALNNLKQGIPAVRTAEVDNPYCLWIGAAIRSDPWGYLAAGWPEKAAELAWRDAYLTHRRGGIYGEMYLAAAQAAAFVAPDARTALEIGLQEIPANCTLAVDLRWALDISASVQDWRHARQLVDERFAGLSSVHTNNNLCLTVFGLLLGQRDVTKVLAETVAMGLDNDCTAASAGSVVGALVGRQAVPEHWVTPFEGKVYSYLTGFPVFEVADLTQRFVKAGTKLW